MKKRVLIIDDSIMIRSILSDIINNTDDLEVIGVASDPYEAREIIKNVRPDVITLDIEMPRMDGLTFLDKLMRAIPISVVMISSLTHENASITLKALELGAVDFIPKPAGALSSLDEIREEILGKIRMAVLVPKSYLEKHKYRGRFTFSPEHVLLSEEIAIINKASQFKKPYPIIAIGASTGGTVAIEKLLKCLCPENKPPIVIVQHIPLFFSKSFADRLNSIVDFNVYEAENGRDVFDGDVFIAKGGSHLLIERTVRGYSIVVKDGPRINRHKPSVDVLFKSVAAAAKDNAVGIILTGMGRDGARGMLEMKNNFAVNIAQEPNECAVSSMPVAAKELGAVDMEFSIEGIASYVNKLFEG